MAPSEDSEQDLQLGPKKKLRRVVVADSSSENEEDKFSGTTDRQEPQKKGPVVDLVAAKVLEREKKSHSPSPFWGDAVCYACKSSSQEKDNSVVQCNECGRNYHQVCHEPPISTAETNDPRFIFRCGHCTRKRENKISTGLTTSNHSKNKNGKDREMSKRKEIDESGLSKRTEKKRQQESPVVQEVEHSPSKSMTSMGLASMAADFYAKRKGLSTVKGVKPGQGQGVSQGPGSSGTGQRSGAGLGRWAQQTQAVSAGMVGLGKLAKQDGSSGAKPALQGSSLMAEADKRLHAMKKKAAQAKLQSSRF